LAAGAVRSVFVEMVLEPRSPGTTPPISDNDCGHASGEWDETPRDERGGMMSIVTMPVELRSVLLPSLCVSRR
jgi:hypothetical protein